MNTPCLIGILLRFLPRAPTWLFLTRKTRIVPLTFFHSWRWLDCISPATESKLAPRINPANCSKLLAPLMFRESWQAESWKAEIRLTVYQLLIPGWWLDRQTLEVRFQRSEVRRDRGRDGREQHVAKALGAERKVIMIRKQHQLNGHQ